MSTGEKQKTSAEDMSSSLPPLKWSEETFNDLVKSFKFPDSWGAICPKEGQIAAQAPTGYITLFWDYFADGNFRLPITKCLLEVLGYYRFHLSQLHPMGMVRIRHFEFLCQSMGIEPLVDRFRVFYQLHCSLGFYSIMQRSAAKKILLTLPKSYHEWKSKLF
ncbi:hypothetical protein HanXRQr2_Chr04g0157661 [Helianthus annuus]|uniref:Transposase (putative) gypsy type domain-containing protein n=1 Tax=Helianthus annuus TaxID=4232 RepID=A0A9K3NQM7_HELAN|nr:hypothetical protein HanXRQr2_Chr04g0157661 [Helianthus annuus]KAJ0588050.1 hypothetical protein HanIR_Chr04g0170141 [Helianthus annuus]